MRSYEVRCPECGEFHDWWETFAPLGEADAEHVVLELCFKCDLARGLREDAPAARLAGSVEAGAREVQA